MMKKFILAAAMVGMTLGAQATGDKLRIYKSGEIQKQIVINDLKDITYSSVTSSNGDVDVINFNLKDGNVHRLALMQLSALEMADNLPDNPMTVSVTPHHMSATLDVKTQAPNSYFRVVGTPEKDLKDIDESLWAEVLVQSDIDYLADACEYYGQPISAFDPDQIFWQGNQVIDWFPSVEIVDGLPVAICLYTCTIVNDEVVVTTEPLLLHVQCKKIEDVGTKWNVTADMTSTRITVKADVSEGPADIQYAIDLYDPIDVYEYGLQTMVARSLYNMESAVYKYGAKWEDLLFTGHGEKTWKNRRSGDVWMAVVYGVEMGVAITDASYVFFEIPLAEVTDPCTFELTSNVIDPSQVEVTVKPSSPSTRYIAYLVETEKITDTEEEKNKAEYYIADRNYWVNVMNSFQWSNGEKIHTGEATLNTLSDMHGGKYLEAGKDYTVLVCGVDNEGGRTTELARLPIKTEGQIVEGLAFDITFSDFQGTDKWDHFITINVKPTKDGEKYALDFLKTNNPMFANIDGMTDDEVINKLVSSYGTYLELHEGEKSFRKTMSSDYSYEQGGWSFIPYNLIVFGYNGAATTPLYVFEVDAATGTVTQKRGPGITPAE